MSRTPSRSHPAIRGLIALAFMSVIFGAAVPAMKRSSVVEDADAIAALATELQDACRRHRADTGLRAIEFAAPQAEHAHGAASYHRLGMRQSYSGWRGPYIDHPLSMAAHPQGGEIRLHSRASDLTERGFALDSDGGYGQFLFVSGVKEATARILDARLDGEKVNPDWAHLGRVAWNKKRNELVITLLD